MVLLLPLYLMLFFIVVVVGVLTFHFKNYMGTQKLKSSEQKYLHLKTQLPRVRNAFRPGDRIIWMSNSIIMDKNKNFI
jgi:hypothetical protein